ncbi:hypothetical protein [Actinophytocola sp.]|uniref:hypothetical protein n=1 Tax=Actinophytocola sp. TaxID=1872138 RepID=UPI003899C36C
MTVQVIIQPSYGKADTRRHWADTLDQPVAFHRYADVLTPWQRERLAATHPDGTARFWGATAKHDKRMATLEAGDVALLTGQKHVRAVGEIGCVFANEEFARTLWRPRPGTCLWRNVYTLRAYRFVMIPYEEVWALPGFTVGDNFMGLRFLGAEKSATIPSGLDVPGLLAAADAVHA